MAARRRLQAHRRRAGPRTGHGTRASRARSRAHPASVGRTVRTSLLDSRCELVHGRTGTHPPCQTGALLTSIPLGFCRGSARAHRSLNALAWSRSRLRFCARPSLRAAKRYPSPPGGRAEILGRCAGSPLSPGPWAASVLGRSQRRKRSGVANRGGEGERGNPQALPARCKMGGKDLLSLRRGRQPPAGR